VLESAGFTAALRAEVAKMIELIPPEDFAIQWDLAVENRYIEGTLAREGLAAARREAERLMAPAREISSYIPDQVALRFHSCFGTLDGWPSRQPPSLGFGHFAGCRSGRFGPTRRFPSSANIKLR